MLRELAVFLSRSKIKKKLKYYDFIFLRDIDTTCQPKKKLADAAHNNDTMFHTMNIAVYEAAEDKKNIYIQWHGMAETRFCFIISNFFQKYLTFSCSLSVAFVSAGVFFKHSIYNDSNSSINKVY